MAEKRDCPLCGETLEDAPQVHDPIKCEKTELVKGRATIKTLKVSVDKWKDAWYHLRELIGKMSWEHNARLCPYERKVMPQQIDVWVNGKLVGSVLTPEAEAAVKRLMSMPDSMTSWLTKKESK